MRLPDTPHGHDLVAALLRTAYRYAYSLTSSESDAEDLVQGAWLRVRERYGEEISQRLMFRVLRNLYLDGYRRELRFPTESLAADTSPVTDHDHSDSEPGGGYDPALARELTQLRDVEREALFLSVIEGYTAAEIAELTDGTRGNVLSLIHRARSKLRDGLAEPESHTDDKPHLVASNRSKPS